MSDDECLALMKLSVELCEGFESPRYWFDRMADEIESGHSYDEVLTYYRELR